ncbi:hypothetical protein BST81_18045 [Leptolyngbya sp. 'hensonii']|uniref:DUF2811 domain-containing protein n=1 Tax=Leptolyngbya sp. 'hensonii' TaxID=1922337 RepID=UPI00094FB421|nr:DUF2811 domain-containing protein [Leptolyngbya sp. 'hensonii']OLP16897.1 hypothetical protein BST81_18045 [Leptolyngbya sp. 'hensonii']
MNATISILVEIPESLHESFQNFLDTRPDWDQDRVFAAALSLFLLQNKGGGEAVVEKHCQRQVARVYLDSLFKSSAGRV